jgi:hypothetical protein
MGANLYPEDVDAALGELADRCPELGLGSFCLELRDVEDGGSVPVVHVEATRHDAEVAELVRRAIGDWLVCHNRDWATAAREDGRALEFDVRPTSHGRGVFAANAGRIKRRYVVTTTATTRDEEQSR